MCGFHSWVLTSKAMVPETDIGGIASGYTPRGGDRIHCLLYVQPPRCPSVAFKAGAIGLAHWHVDSHIKPSLGPTHTHST